MHHKAGEPTESHGCSQRLSAEKYRHLSLAAEAGNSPHKAPGRNAPRVLIVDDEPDIQKMLDTFLSMQGYSIETVSNGEAALCRLQDQPFDLVLTEYSMPGMNGLELLDRIKSQDETIEVILLTGYGTVEYAVTAFKEGGAFDFIQKPLNDVNLLLVSVERALERRDLRRKNDRMLVELKKLSAAIEHTPNMMVVMDECGRIEYANPKYLEITGDSRQDCMDTVPSILKREMHDPEAFERLWETLASGQEWRGEFLNRNIAQEPFWEQVSISSIRDEAEKITHFVMVAEDITERKRAEKALSASEAFNTAILSAITYPILVLDEKGDVIRSNPAGLDLLLAKTGKSPSDARGGSYLDCCRDALHQAGFQPPDHIEWTLGGIRDVVDGISERFEAQVACEMGGEKRWYLLQVSRLDVTTRRTLICQIDITLLKQMEDRLVHQRKMEAVATLAGGIAHEYNNTLSTMVGNADLIDIKVNGSIDIKKHLDAIYDAGIRMRNLSDRLLTYARGRSESTEIIRVGEWLPEFLKTFGRDLPRAIRIDTRVQAKDAAVHADILQLRIVLAEVMNNSLEALKGQGRIQIGVEKIAPDQSPDQRVCITVEDNGPGMDEKALARVFEPFFTSKFIGSGVGMAVVYGIIKGYNGKVEIDSEVGKGTRVRIILPAA